jgi:hypothetical protein
MHSDVHNMNRYLSSLEKLPSGKTYFVIDIGMHYFERQAYDTSR